MVAIPASLCRVQCAAGRSPPLLHCLPRVTVPQLQPTGIRSLLDWCAQVLIRKTLPHIHTFTGKSRIQVKWGEVVLIHPVVVSWIYCMGLDMWIRSLVLLQSASLREWNALRLLTERTVRD